MASSILSCAARWRSLSCWWLPSRGAAVTLVMAATTVAIAVSPAAQHLHLFGHDVRGVAILPGVLVLPLTRFQAAFDVDRTAFAQVFARNLGQAVVENDAVPFGVFAAFAGVAVFLLRRGGNGYVADCAAVRRVAHLRVAPKVANQYHLVD